MHAVDAFCASKTGALRQSAVEIFVHQEFDLSLDIVGQLEAGRAEQLDAVVLEQIVGRGNHHAEIGAHRFGQHRHRGRRHRAKLKHIHAHRGEARDQRGLDHVAGQPCVLADHDAMTVLAALKGQPRGLPDLQRQFRRDQTVRAAPNPVRAKIFAAHDPPSGVRGLWAEPAQGIRTPAHNSVIKVIRPLALKWLQKI
jgi:hypothetical protein